MKKFILFFSTLLLLLNYYAESLGRSVHRPKDPTLPEISVRWTNGTRLYHLKSSHLEFYPFFGIFEKQFFQNHLLPSGPIAYRNAPEKAVQADILNSQIEELLEEIKQKKKTFKNFIILTRKNFNRKKSCGMMVLKFKNYPFILKLCMETPKTFTNPYCKGLDNIWFFPLGGGMNRHLAGLTRIKNLETIKNKLSQHPEWSTTVDLPNKWHWVPKKQDWLEISGTNMGDQKQVSIQIPATYCIIADAIEAQEELSIFNTEHTTFAMSLCNYLELGLDPHINNFMIEKNTKKIVIVDTEHFPSVVGIKKKVTFDGYFAWYTYLASKCAKNWFFRTKDERLTAQKAKHTWNPTLSS
ncbi:MAG: hypothetical protein NTX86_01830 [Candidatus Dependentiae bacterium]|nr:hypothetical protein [Candidatus Dependentiae bacterium]